MPQNGLLKNNKVYNVRIKRSDVKYLKYLKMRPWGEKMVHVIRRHFTSFMRSISRLLVEIDSGKNQCHPFDVKCRQIRFPAWTIFSPHGRILKCFNMALEMYMKGNFFGLIWKNSRNHVENRLTPLSYFI